MTATIDSVIALARQDHAPAYAEQLTQFAVNHTQNASRTSHPEASRIAVNMAADCILLAAGGDPDTFGRRMQAFLAATRVLETPRDERNRLVLADDEARRCFKA